MTTCLRREHGRECRPRHALAHPHRANVSDQRLPAESIGLFGNGADTAVITGSAADENALIATPTATIMASSASACGLVLRAGLQFGRRLWDRGGGKQCNSADNATLYGAGLGHEHVLRFAAL